MPAVLGVGATPIAVPLPRWAPRWTAAGESAPRGARGDVGFTLARVGGGRIRGRTCPAARRQHVRVVLSLAVATVAFVGNPGQRSRGPLVFVVGDVGGVTIEVQEQQRVCVRLVSTLRTERGDVPDFA